MVEFAGSREDDEPRFNVGALIQPAAALGPRVSHYRLLEGPPMSWDDAEQLVRRLNRSPA